MGFSSSAPRVDSTVAASMEASTEGKELLGGESTAASMEAPILPCSAASSPTWAASLSTWLTWASVFKISQVVDAVIIVIFIAYCAAELSSQGEFPGHSALIHGLFQPLNDKSICFLDPDLYNPVMSAIYIGGGILIAMMFTFFAPILVRTKNSLGLLIWIGSGSALIFLFWGVAQIETSGTGTQEIRMLFVQLTSWHFSFDFCMGFGIWLKSAWGVEWCAFVAVLISMIAATLVGGNHVNYASVIEIFILTAYPGHLLSRIAMASCNPNNPKNRLLWCISVMHSLPDLLHAFTGICAGVWAMPTHAFGVVPAVVIYWAVDSGKQLRWADSIASSSEGLAESNAGDAEAQSLTKSSSPGEGTGALGSTGLDV